MKNILVTGGAGYKGIPLTEKLLQQGHKVTVIDNFMYGYEPILHLVRQPNLNIIKQDVRNEIADLNKFDVVFHLAGISGFPACANNPHSAFDINVMATKKILLGLSSQQMFINASTTSMYGKSGLPCDELSQVEPVSTYAITKLQAEKETLGMNNVVNLRFATVFGFAPKMRMDLMVNDFTYKAVKDRVVVLFDSFAKRTFIHVNDAADCYIFTMENFDKMKGGVFNAGGNQNNHSKMEIAELIQEKIDFKIINSELKDKDLRHFEVNFNKIEALGYVPKISVRDGLSELIKAFGFYESHSFFKVI